MTGEMMTDNDIEQIHRLKYAYLRALDTKHWDDLGATLTPDAEGRYASGSAKADSMTFHGREEIVTFLRTAMPVQVISEHRVTHPVIDIDGDEATGSWYLQDRILVPAAEFMLIGAAYYSDRYRRTEAGWQISATGYSRTYEATMSTQGLGLIATLGPLVAAD